VVNVNDPDNPFVEGSEFCGGPPIALAVSRNYAYYASRTGWLNPGGRFSVINVSDPANPHEEGSCHPFQHSPTGLEISGNYAYSTGDSEFRVVNVSDPANPYEEGFYDTPGSAQNVAFSGSYAYVADGDSGLRVIDISDPAGPYEVGFCDTLSSVSDVAVSGGYAYVVTDSSDLRVVNISDPSSPYEEGFYVTLGVANGVAVSGDYIYVADGDSGLTILEFTGGTEVEENIDVFGELPASYSLNQNYPNPFNPETWISYQLPERSPVTIKIYNVTGQLVNTLVDDEQAPGAYRVRWSGRDLHGAPVASGIYFCRLKAGTYNKSIKMVLMK
jgi:hypothetical protein